MIATAIPRMPMPATTHLKMFSECSELVFIASWFLVVNTRAVNYITHFVVSLDLIVSGVYNLSLVF